MTGRDMLVIGGCSWRNGCKRALESETNELTTSIASFFPLPDADARLNPLFLGSYSSSLFKSLTRATLLVPILSKFAPSLLRPLSRAQLSSLRFLSFSLDSSSSCLLVVSHCYLQVLFSMSFLFDLFSVCFRFVIETTAKIARRVFLSFLFLPSFERAKSR